MAGSVVGEPGNRELEAACEMIDLAALCWAQELEQGSRREILSLSWTTFRLLEFADALILCS